MSEIVPPFPAHGDFVTDENGKMTKLFWHGQWIDPPENYADTITRLEGEVERLRAITVVQETLIRKAEAENERLRDMVRRAYNDGFGEGIKEHTTHKGGTPWTLSKWPAVISQEPQG